MLSDQTSASASSSGGDQGSVPTGDETRERRREEEPEFRDIHALSTPRAPDTYRRRRSRESIGSAVGRSRHTSIRSVGSDTAPGEHFPSMSREFSAMVAAANGGGHVANSTGDDALGRIGEEELEETNPLAIVPDNSPVPSTRRGTPGHGDEVSVSQFRKEEVESKIAAWQIAEVAKVNNRFKREEVVINGWEGDQVEKASAWLNKYERKLEEKRAKAMEKAQNEVVNARRNAEDKRASAEAKKFTKLARVLELANFMRAMGRAPAKRSFF